MSAYSSFLKNTFLFKGVTEEEISDLLRDIVLEEKNYSKGETIICPDGFERKLGIVLKGECLVARHASGGFVPLNTIKASESFGILTVFSPREDFPTMVTAKKSVSVLFFSENEVRHLIESSPKVSMNIIEFFARKVSFLNDKIASFSGGSIEEKLAGYILEQQKRNNSLSFDFNKKKSSEALNCGRASLYRAISALESEGLISFENKKIIINDQKGLERILK